MGKNKYISYWFVHYSLNVALEKIYYSVARYGLNLIFCVKIFVLSVVSWSDAPTAPCTQDVFTVSTAAQCSKQTRQVGFWEFAEDAHVLRILGWNYWAREDKCVSLYYWWIHCCSVYLLKGSDKQNYTMHI